MANKSVKRILKTEQPFPYIHAEINDSTNAIVKDCTSHFMVPNSRISVAKIAIDIPPEELKYTVNCELGACNEFGGRKSG